MSHLTGGSFASHHQDPTPARHARVDSPSHRPSIAGATARSERVRSAELTGAHAGGLTRHHHPVPAEWAGHRPLPGLARPLTLGVAFAANSKPAPPDHRRR